MFTTDCKAVWSDGGYGVIGFYYHVEDVDRVVSAYRRRDGANTIFDAWKLSEMKKWMEE